MSREIKDQYGVIDRLAQEMQGAIMAVRMQPISEAFDRFPRLVRDLARKLSKKIDLAMEGEETAADKAIIAALGEPLLHILRSSIDHGIETPEERVAAGKSSQAHILLRACQESDQIVIEVIDDGRGIDPVKIKTAALSKGVITEDQASRLSDQEAINLVFQPGFSTASEVSDLSSRGVGMDVVRSNIEKMGGQVAVSSAIGTGATVRLSLPLSMAVTRVLDHAISNSLSVACAFEVTTSECVAPDAGVDRFAKVWSEPVQGKYPHCEYPKQGCRLGKRLLCDLGEPSRFEVSPNPFC